MAGEGKSAAAVDRLRPEALRFAVVGTHNTGKTTICHEVAGRLMRRGIATALAPEPSRTSRYIAEGARGIPAQVDLFARTVANEFEAARQSRVVVCDRSLIDVLAYTDALPEPVSQTQRSHKEAMLAFAERYVPTYATVFKPTWRFPMADSEDPLREGDDSFQLHIDRNIAGYLEQLAPFTLHLTDPDTAAEEIESHVISLLDGDGRGLQVECAL